MTAINANAGRASYSAGTGRRGATVMPWNTILAALLVLAAAFGALGISLGLALLLGGAHWPETQADGLRWSGAVSTQATARQPGGSRPTKQ
ncbi:MAG: hypothetical protein ACHQIO_01520 [Nevskiales bacterium]